MLRLYLTFTPVTGDTMSPTTMAMPAGVALYPGRGNLDHLTIDTPACTGEMYLHGAHVCAWGPRGGEPVIWMSAGSAFEAGRPIRGGVPLCFPWFGPHPTNPGRAPHGFARLLRWTLDRVARDAASGANLMPAIVEAVKAYASVGEITKQMVKVFGRYREPIRF